MSSKLNLYKFHWKLNSRFCKTKLHDEGDIGIIGDWTHSRYLAKINNKTKAKSNSLSFCTLVLGAPSYDPIVEKGWTLVPDENGNLKMVTLEELEFQYALAKRAKVVVKFTLYTRANPTKGEEMVPNDAAWLAQSNFNPANPTRYVT